MRPRHYLLRGITFELCASNVRVCRSCGAPSTSIECRLGAEDVGWCDDHAPADVVVLVYDRATQQATPRA